MCATPASPRLYEGTNGIQALDLVGRKLGAHMGRMLRRFFHPLAEFLEANKSDEAMTEFVKPLAKAFGRLQEGTTWIAQNGMRDPDEAGAAAVDYLQLFALVAYGWMWARMAKVALAKQGGDEAEFYQAKLATGRFLHDPHPARKRGASGGDQGRQGADHGTR